MAVRQTMNVSLTPDQDRFVRDQVQTGRYRTASEVVRDGLRLLEAAEHRRLLEKSLYEGLTPAEEARLPQELLDHLREGVAAFLEEGRRSGREEGWLDGAAALRRLRRKLERTSRS